MTRAHVARHLTCVIWYTMDLQGPQAVWFGSQKPTFEVHNIQTLSVDITVRYIAKGMFTNIKD